VEPHFFTQPGTSEHQTTKKGHREEIPTPCRVMGARKMKRRSGIDILSARLEGRREGKNRIFHIRKSINLIRGAAERRRRVTVTVGCLWIEKVSHWMLGTYPSVG